MSVPKLGASDGQSVTQLTIRPQVGFRNGERPDSFHDERPERRLEPD